MRVTAIAVAAGLAFALAPTEAFAKHHRRMPAVSAETRACQDAIISVIQQTRQDAAMMRQMATQARADNRPDLAAHYDRMAVEHARHVDQQIAALATYGGTAPADSSPAGGTHPADLMHAIEMHSATEAKYAAAAQTERCVTAKRLYLVLAICTARHVSELKRLLPAPPGQALAPSVIYIDRVVDRVIDRPVDRVVERIVDRPVERIVERVVDRPVERIVERVIVRQAPARAPRRRPAN